jgi:hypothetical protein
MNALGIAPRKQGVFEEYFFVNDMPGNIFTVWRFLVEDFSVIGPIVLNSTFAVCFLAFQASGYKFFSQPLKLFVIVGVMLSLATSVFAYNSVVLAFALAAGYTFVRCYPWPSFRIWPAVPRSSSVSTL